MGAIRYCEKGAGDGRSDDLEAAWRQWAASLLSQLLSDNSMSAESTDPLIYGRSAALDAVKISFIDPHDERFQESRENLRTSCQAEIHSLTDLNRSISDPERKTLEVMVKLPEGATYDVGDHLELWPQNDPRLARRAVAKLGFAPDATFEIEPSVHLPPRSMAGSIKGPCTIENAFIHFADLSSPPPRSMLHLLANRLRETSPSSYMELKIAAEGDPNSSKSADLRNGFLAQYPTVLDVILKFGCEDAVTFGDLLFAIPTISSRRYSIASSPLVSPTSVRLVVRLVSWETLDKRILEGQSSGFFSRSQVGSTLRAVVRRTAFKPSGQPLDASTILVCAGTGVAPFLGFLENRQQLRKDLSSAPQDKMTLYFGCRDESDWIFKEKMQEWKADGTLDSLNISMSRVDDFASQQYVSHALLQDGLEIVGVAEGRFIFKIDSDSLFLFYFPQWRDSERASFYICGSASSMARDVRKSIGSSEYASSFPSFFHRFLV